MASLFGLAAAQAQVICSNNPWNKVTTLQASFTLQGTQDFTNRGTKETYTEKDSASGTAILTLTPPNSCPADLIGGSWNAFNVDVSDSYSFTDTQPCLGGSPTQTIAKHRDRWLDYLHIWGGKGVLLP